MDKDVRLSPAGLWLAPSTLEAPPGGLDKAEEIVIRRKGRAEVRPGFAPAAVFGNDPARLIDFSGHYLGVDPTLDTRWDDDTDVLTEDSQDLDWDADGIEGVESRKNLYVTTSDGVRKVESDTSQVARRTGAPTCTIAAEAGGAGTAVDATSRVGYRALIMRKDANELEVRSAPSNRTILTNSTGAGVQGLVTVALHFYDDFAVGDVIELYRSENFPQAVLPLDLHQLAAVHPITSADLSAGYVVITDDTDDQDLGVDLYTNEDIEGPEASHVRPPKAKTATLFNNSLFLGNLQYPPELIISANISGSDLAGTTEGIGARFLGATMTNGSAVVTLASTTGLLPGMVVFSTDATDWVAGSAYPRIVSVDNGTQITLSRTWDGTSDAHFLLFIDSIRIGSLYHPIGLGGAVFAFSVRGVLEQYPDLGVEFTEQDADQNVTADLITTETSAISNGVRIISIRGLTPISTPQLVYATNGDEYNPILTEPSGAGVTMPQDILPSCVAWSDALQPEHFKRANIDFVGHQETGVMTLKAIRNCVLVAKSDGLYRVSGAGESTGFRFEEHDRNVRLLFPAAAAVLGEKCYLWGDAGVFECDESSALDISTIAIEPALKAIQRAIGPGSTTAVGAWIIPNRKGKEILLSVPDTSDLTVGARLFVFNQATGTWVNWFMAGGLVCGLCRAQDGTLRIQHTNGDTLEERAEDARADAVISVTIDSFDGTEVVISAGSDWTPAVGDNLTRAGTVMRVVEITSATVFTTDVEPPSTGAATAEVAIRSTLRFIGHAGKNPGVMKVWAEGAVWWGDTRGLVSQDITTTSALDSTGISQTKTLGDTPISGNKELPEAFRFRVPRNHSRSTRLYVEVAINAAGATWAIDAVSVDYRIAGDRVRKR